MRPYLGDLHVLALVVLAEEIEEAVELAVREVLRAHALRPRVVPRPRALAVARGPRRVDAAVGRPVERDRDRVARADAEVDVRKVVRDDRREHRRLREGLEPLGRAH